MTPVELYVDKHFVFKAEKGKDGLLEMVCQPMVNANFMELSCVVRRTFLDRAFKQAAVFLQQSVKRLTNSTYEIIFHSIPFGSIAGTGQKPNDEAQRREPPA